MELRIEGRNLNIGRRLETSISRKCSQVERHLPAAGFANVEITFEPTRSQQERYLAQISLDVKGTILRAERRGSSALSAVSAAAARLDQMVSRFKGQVYRSQRGRSYVSLGEQQAADSFEQDLELAQLYPEDAEGELAVMS